MIHTLDQALRLLHPFMPFLTEELWSRLPLARRDAESLVIAPWPVATGMWRDAAAAALLDQQIAVVLAVRSVRGENRIAPRTPLTIAVWPGAVSRGRAHFSSPGKFDFQDEAISNAVIVRSRPTRFPDEVPFEIERILR